jgi:hypothetical protein
MKPNPLFKTIAFIACILFLFSNTKLSAQSIAGHWKLVEAKEIVTDKATGKEQDISGQMKEMMAMMHSEITFNSDGTYSATNTMGNSKKGLTTTGTYTVSGNQLTIKATSSNMPALQKQSANQLPPTVTIQSVSASTLVLHYTSEGMDTEKKFRVAITNTYQKQ